MKKLTLQQKVLADVDDEIWLLKKRIELKYDLNFKQARDLTNWALRVLMLSYPEYWLESVKIKKKG